MNNSFYLKVCAQFIGIAFLLNACQKPSEKAKEPQGFSIEYKGEIAKLSSSEIEKSPWGIHFNGMPFHDLVFAQYDSLNVDKLLEELPVLIEKTSELGLKWARVSVDWGLIEDNKGEFHWELLDPMIDGLVDAGVEVYPSLHAGHFVHTDNAPPIKQSEIDAWLNFVEKVVERYQDKIVYWEIWNEPNTIWFWGDNPQAHEYFELVKQTTALIKRVDATSKIIGGSLARLDVPFADTLFQMGIAEYIDVLSFHPYGVFPEAALKKMDVQVRMPLLYEPVMNPVEGLQTLIAESGKDIALWQGECGYPSAMNGGGWNGTGPYGEEVQAKWILRRAFSDMSYDAEVSAYFMLKENKHPYYDFYNYKGLLEFADLKPKLGFDVFQNLNSVMNGDFVRDTTLKCTPNIVDDGGLFGIRPKNIQTVAFSYRDETWVAYWAVTHLQNEHEPAKVDIEIGGTGNGNAELVDFYTGKIFTVKEVDQTRGSVILKSLPLSDYPYLIKLKK